MKNKIYIKYLPKDELLYNLWKNANPARYFNKCRNALPNLSINKAKRDINYMICNNRNIELTTYYGKTLYIDITGDYVDVFAYNLYNGKCQANKIINEIKICELKKTILKYYTFF